MRIGHISDLHLYNMTGARVRDFLNKRLTGGLNLLLGRRGLHQEALTQKALEILKEQCDHLVVAGDLTNLSLPSEFDSVYSLLHRYFDAQNMTIVPGNHDYYTLESAVTKRFERTMYRSKQNEVHYAQDEATWPFVKIREDIAFIGLNSARPRPWFVASGKLGDAQREALQALLSCSEVRNKFKVVALHHHIFQAIQAPGESLRDLRDREAFLAILREHKVDLLVHGHNHISDMQIYGTTLISEAGSVSEDGGGKSKRRGKFKIYDVVDKQIRSIETWRYQDSTFCLAAKHKVMDNKIVVSS